MEEKILEILRRVLEDSSLDKTCSMENCEMWDSLRQLNVCFELEGEFGVMFEPEEMAEMKSFDDIVTVLNRKL